MCGVTTEIRCVSKVEGYNEIFEIIVARSTAEIMSYDYRRTPAMMS